MHQQTAAVQQGFSHARHDSDVTFASQFGDVTYKQAVLQLPSPQYTASPQYTGRR